MNISDIPDTPFTLPEKSFKNIRFIKNEEGKRVAQQLQDSDVEKIKEEKNIGVLIIGGHMEHTQMAIIEALNSHDIKGDIVLIAGPEFGTIQGITGPVILEEHLKELSKTHVIIDSIPHDLVQLFLEKETKPYSRFHANRYVLKPQKSKAAKWKYTQRKK